MPVIVKIFISILSLLFTTFAWADNISCHPPINPNIPQYMVGYGSLMQNESKKRTDPNSGISIPVLVTGYQRAWITPEKVTFDNFGFTALGVRIDSKATFNGVIFNLSSEAMGAYDNRELGYCRVAINPDNIKILTKDLTLPSGQFWLYVNDPKNSAVPTKKYPIVESYVDTFISGCLELANKYQLSNFAQQCINTTADWSFFWVNDRVYPRRPYIMQPQAKSIDSLLIQILPEYVKQMKAE